MLLNITQSVDHRLTHLIHVVVAVIRQLLPQHKAHEIIRKRGMNSMPLAAMMTAQSRAVSLNASQNSCEFTIMSKRSFLVFLDLLDYLVQNLTLTYYFLFFRLASSIDLRFLS